MNKINYNPVLEEGLVYKHESSQWVSILVSIIVEMYFPWTKGGD